MPSPLKIRERVRRALIGRSAAEKYALHSSTVPVQPPPPRFTIFELSNLIMDPYPTMALSTLNNGQYFHLLTEGVIQRMAGVKRNHVISPQDLVDVEFLSWCIGLIMKSMKVEHSDAAAILRRIVEELAEDELEGRIPRHLAREGWMETYLELEDMSDGIDIWGMIDRDEWRRETDERLVTARSPRYTRNPLRR